MACLAVLLMLAIPASAEVEVAVPGSGAGQVLDPAALAADPAQEALYVADFGNRRVGAFAADGGFERAFGWGVVASGPNNDPQNQVERVEVTATGGKFTLLFVQNSHETIGLIKEETGFVDFNAPASAVEAALEALVPLGPADVAVAGPAGGPWTVEFTDAFADTALHQLEQGSATELTGGSASLAISTLQEGANHEVCEQGLDVCRTGQRGPEPGQLNPASVAVDPASSDVYVFDGLETSSHNEPPNNRVQRFEPDGTFVYMIGGGVDVDSGEDLCTAASGHTCGRGAKGSGSGEFNAARSSIAVGPAAVLYVNDGGRVQKFDSSGALIGQVSLPGVSRDFLAVDSAGSIYAGTNSEIRKFDPAGSVLYGISDSNINAIAVDQADNLYVSNLSSGKFGISRYDSAGSLVQVFYSAAGTLANQGTPAKALAPLPGGPEGDIFAAEGGRVSLLSFPPVGPVVYPNPESIVVTQVSNVKATFHSEVNPEGESTTFHYEYVDDAAFQADGWASTAVKESDESAPAGADFTLHPASQTVTDLTPETVYHFRVVATNADAPGGAPGPEATFETEPPLALGAIWATDVGTAEASLHGEVNPFGIAATGYFEYVDDATFQASGFDEADRSPAGPPLDFGAGEDFVARSAAVTSLQPGTAYHYRLVATDNCKPDEPSVVCEFPSAPATFRTFPVEAPVAGCPGNEAFRSGPGAFLPDCRAYEMVSPVDKNGSNVEALINLTGYPTELNQSAAAGSKLTYSAYRAFADPESAPYTVQFLSERSGDGWSNRALPPPREGPTYFTNEGLDLQFKAFTENLCRTWLLQDTPLLLSPGALSSYPNLYGAGTCGPPSYEAVTTVAPAGGLPPRLFLPDLQGFSSDGLKSFYSVPANLNAGVPEEVSEVYEASGGSLTPVCKLPDNSVTKVGCSLGTASGFGQGRGHNVANAVSDDGSVAYWSESTSGPGKMYVRVGGLETHLVSAAAGRFWTAASDGSVALYTSGGKLFQYDLDLKSSSEIADGVVGVAGWSEDADHVYFVSTNVLAAGATVGQPNLYLHQGGSFAFIGTLSAADVLNNRPSPIAERPNLRTARVTPDGGRIVFMSKARLTGYDNTDVVSGEPASEVFRFDATVGADGQLFCVSCNPSGARPHAEPWDIAKIIGGFAAAWIPGWSTHLYGPRAVSTDGARVYFNSFDQLVGRDVNDAQDVYQWELPGSGSCAEASPSFVPANGGCVSLISSGESSEDSELVDASETGADLFFKTYSRLADQDPGLLDIYDARVDGGIAGPPGFPEGCEGEGCLPPAPPSPPRPTPQSAVFVGPADRVERAPRRKRCQKGKHRKKRTGKRGGKRKSKFVCVKNKKQHRKKSGKHRRGGRTKR